MSRSAASGLLGLALLVTAAATPASAQIFGRRQPPPEPPPATDPALIDPEVWWSDQ